MIDNMSDVLASIGAGFILFFLLVCFMIALNIFADWLDSKIKTNKDE